MEETNLILMIQSSYNQFTKAEKKIAEYCLNHRDEIPYLSISGLADACEVGDASVYRFCRSLKLDGYQEFKMKFSLSQNSAGTVGSAIHSDSDFSANSLAQRVLASHINAMEETFQLLDAPEFERVLNMLEQAQHVFFFGVGDSLLAAEEARNKFLRITPKVNCVTDPHMQAVTASLAEEKDLFVFISYSGATKDNVQTAKIAKARGAHVVCISHFQKSPLTAYCDIVLLCGSKEGPLDRGSMSAKAGQLYLIDLLYQSFYERNLNVSVRNNELTAASVVEKSF